MTYTPGTFGYSDAARRCSDIVTEAAQEGFYGHWIAIRLSDGGSDGRKYMSKQEAIRFQLHEKLCAYVCVPLGHMPPGEAEAFLSAYRKAYDGGARWADPAAPDLMVPIRLENIRREHRR
jgi:hypothetical protein